MMHMVPGNCIVQEADSPKPARRLIEPRPVLLSVHGMLEKKLATVTAVSDVDAAILNAGARNAQDAVLL